MSSKDAKEESTKSDFDDETTHVHGSTDESSKKKELKGFEFVSEDGEHVLLTKEQISAQKKIEKEAKAKAARREACPNKKRKGWTSIYKQIRERIDYLCTTEVELKIDLDRPLSDQDPLDRLNDLANKKRKHADDIHDFFRANKRLKSSVQYKDHPAAPVLNEPVLGVDDHARTFCSLLLAEFDKRNLNLLKQMRVIEQISFSQRKPKLRPTKDFKAKYNKVKAKLALLSSSASASKAVNIKYKGLITEAYEWDEEEVSLVDNECINEQILKKRILRANQLTEDPSSSRQKDLVFVKSSADDTKVSIPGVERLLLSEAEGFILPNHDTGRILPAESQRNTTDPSVAVTDSSATDYDSA
nr:hypothetical protein [Tanacetum cinerariifolium]